jgi:alkylated DNA repair dioxygenase AlkB
MGTTPTDPGYRSGKINSMANLQGLRAIPPVVTTSDSSNLMAPMTAAQANLFPVGPNVPRIGGLRYYPEVLTCPTERIVLDSIDQQGVWLKDLRRRVQHYGYRYDYKARVIDESMRAAPFPYWLTDLASNLVSELDLHIVFNQAIVNEYLPGQGIYRHVDCEPCFADTIVSVSLGSSCVMDFFAASTLEKRELVLEPRSALILQGEARYQWMHGIAPRKFDRINGEKVARSRRVSITFRRAILRQLES